MSRLKVIITIVTLMGISLLGSCALKSTKDIIIDGSIDATFVERLHNVPSGSWIKVSSSGGDPGFAYKAAKIISSKKIKLKVVDGCFSSCAEYLLPAAYKLKFYNALIGFHQSPPLISKLKEMNSSSTKPICYYDKQIEPLKELQLNSLGIESFWLETLKRLKIKDVQLRDKEDCIEVGFSFENEFWIPNKAQLQNLYKLNFSGNLCSEDKACYPITLNRIAPEGTRFIVGEDLYVVKGKE